MTNDLTRVCERCGQPQSSHVKVDNLNIPERADWICQTAVFKPKLDRRVQSPNSGEKMPPAQRTAEFPE